MFSFKKRLFAWSTFQAHMTDGVRKLLKLMKTDDALIPVDLASMLKHLVLNKPSKDHITESYDEWLASSLHSTPKQEI